ncbi:glycoside hydrolase family 42 [Opitutaceae bacterium TAV5]|nr:glycoside hydrolase family 42 [Opitutaceae bacterium TAV5]
MMSRSSSRTARAAFCLAACIAILSALPASADPLDNVSAYSLQIGSDGVPLPGHFRMGLRGGGAAGQPHLTVHSGFNVWQVQPDNNKFAQGVPFRDAGEPEYNLNERYGYFYYTQARAALALRRGKPRPPGQIGPYHFPPFVQEDGKPAPSNLLINIFTDTARAYFTDYAKTLATSSWGQGPVAKPTLFWGMDNEWEGRLDYAPEARQAYIAWLKTRYRDLDDINHTWGTRFRSFDELRDSALPTTAEFATRPGEFLVWHTFHREAFTSLLADMADALHTNDPHHRPVVYKSTQQSIEYPFVKRSRVFDQVLFGERARAFGGGHIGVNIYGAGDRQAYETNYIYNIIRPLDDALNSDGHHGVMCPELNNHSGPGHQWGATFWRVLPNGLKAANFFTTGYEGAKGDYATFGHFAPDGTARAKMFYSARWAHMVHRTEALWTAARPAPDMPRIAMLLPRRDVILAERTDRRVSKWAYPMNHRVMVYGWLREQGYWVDVIPETKLDAAYLSKNYNALVLIGAEHLATSEADAITRYVRDGGVLLADERPGHFDELHREKRQLEPILGVALGRYDNTPSSRFTFGKRQAPLTGVRATGRLELRTTSPTAKTLLATDDARPLVTTNTAGKGRVIHLAFMTGDLREDVNLPVEVSTFTSSHGNETADTGDAGTPQPGGAVSRWLAGLLSDAGVAPAYTARGITAAEAAILRVEQPVTDSLGNLAVVATVRGSADPDERVPSATLDLPLPGGPWTRALWGSAEDAGLSYVEIRPVPGGAPQNLHRVKLPAIETAGILYLLKTHSPLISIPKIDTPDRAIDGHAARVRPGASFQVKTRLVNPTSAAAPAGRLRLAAVQGWTVTPSDAATGELAPGQAADITFTVTPSDASALKRNWLYPLVARWSSEGTDRSIAAANVEAWLQD